MLALVILHELGYQPRCASGGALLFHMLSKIYERTNVVINSNLSLSGWAMVLYDAKMTIALLTAVTSLKPKTTASAQEPVQPLQPTKRRKQTRP